MIKNELIQSIIDAFQRLRPLVVSQFVRPLKEIESVTFPPGYNNVMCCIKAKGEGPVSMTDLAVAANIAKPNLTTIIDRLLLEGFVERSNDVNDRRIVNISLTQSGCDFLRGQKEDLEKLVENQFSLCDGKDLLKLKRALEDIAEVLGKMNNKI
jgi:DNA-binding MarR family transcriptional regulator